MRGRIRSRDPRHVRMSVLVGRMPNMSDEISQAANTLVPAILALEALGFTLTVQGDLVEARSDAGRYVAPDPVGVLGLVKLVETRGSSWRATDSEIDATLERFGLNG